MSLSFQTGNGEEPIERVKAIEITLPRSRSALLGPVELKGALQVPVKMFQCQFHAGQLHAAEVIQELGPQPVVRSPWPVLLARVRSLPL